MRTYIASLLFIANFAGLYGQKVSGYVFDTTSSPITNCNITAIDPSTGAIIDFTAPTKLGYYELNLRLKGLKFVSIQCRGLAYHIKSFDLALSDTMTAYRHNFMLSEKVIELAEVVIRSQRPKMTINEDTVVFDVNQLAHQNDLKVIDLLKRLPGIEVNEKTGNITYKGRPIETLLIDGDDLLSKRYSIGVRSIPIRILDKIEAIENYHVNPLEKGLFRSEKVVLNLKLKKNHPVLTGELGAATGLQHYFGKADLILLSDKNKALVVGEVNNISMNETPFNGSVYQSENREEYNLYSFDPLGVSSIKNPPDFERSYDNRLSFGDYNHHLKIGKKIGIRTELAAFQDRMLYKTQREIFFFIRDLQSFEQTNSSLGVYSPTAFTATISAKGNFSAKEYATYDLRWMHNQLNASQKNVQNPGDIYLSDIAEEKNFLRQQFSYSYKFAEKYLLKFDATSAEDRLSQVLEIRMGNPIKDSLYSYARFDNRRQIGIFAASLLSKLENGVFQIQFQYEGLKENFTYRKGIASSTAYRRNSTALKTQFQHDLFNTKKSTFQLGASLNHMDQALVYEPVFALADERNLFYNVSANVNLEIGDKNKLLFRSALENTPPSIQYLHRVRYFSDSRFIYTNNPSLELQKTWTNGLTFSRFNLHKQNNQTYNLQYDAINNNFFAAQEIDSQLSIITYFRLPLERRSLSLGINQSYLMYSLSNVFSFKFNSYFDWYYNQLNQSSPSKIFSIQTSLELDFNSAFTGRFNYRIHGGYTYSISKQVGFNDFQLGFFGGELALHYTLFKDTQIKWVSNLILPQEIVDLGNQIFCDIFVNKRLAKQEMEIFLIGRNLFNRNSFVQLQTTEFSRSYLSTSLFPANIVLGVNFSL